MTTEPVSTGRSPANWHQNIGIWGYTFIACIASVLFVLDPNFLDRWQLVFRYTYNPLAVLFTLLLIRGYVLEKQGKIHSDEPRLGSFGVCLAIYFAALPLSYGLIARGVTSGYEIPVAILPVIPAIVGAVLAVRYIQKSDELIVRKASEASVFALLTTCITALTFGLLEENGLARLPMIWILPIGIGYWSLGMLVSRKRYE